MRSLLILLRVSGLLKSGMLALLLIALAGFWQVAAAQFITVQNGNFSRAGSPWFPYDLNYWPHYALQFPYSFYPEYWLGDGYNPAAVEADLTAMASLGVNCISTQASLLVEQAPANLPGLPDPLPQS